MERTLLVAVNYFSLLCFNYASAAYFIINKLVIIIIM